MKESPICDTDTRKGISMGETLMFAGFVCVSLVLAGALEQRAPAQGNGAIRWDPEQRLTNDPGASLITYNFARSLAADGARGVHAVWYDVREGGSQVYYARSRDGGRTWGTPLRLSTVGAMNEHPAIAVAGSRVYVVWHGKQPDHGVDLHLRRSPDGGTTWEPEAQLTQHGAAAYASLAVVGECVHLIWGDTRSGESEIYTRRSLDGARTWGEEHRLSDTPHESWVPSIAAEGELVVAAWVDTQDGNEEEYAAVSNDAGVTWGSPVRVTQNRMNSWAPSVAVSGGTIHLAWFDQQDAPAHPLEAEARLDEAMRLLGLEPGQAPEGVMVPDPETPLKQRATEKLQMIHREAPGWVSRGGDAGALQAIMQAFEELASPVKVLQEGEAVLSEALSLLGLEATPAPKSTGTETDPVLFQRDIQAKVQRIQGAAPGWVQRGGDPKALQAVMERFEQVTQPLAQSAYVAKEHKLDEALALMGLSYVPSAEPPPVPKLYYAEALGQRVQQKARRIRAEGPAWVARGGDRQQLEAILKEFERLMRAANEEWDIYYTRSTDGGRTWAPTVRLTDAAGPSQRPSLVAEGNRLHVVWFDQRDGNTEVYYRGSADGGLTWLPEMRVTQAAGESLHPTVASSAGAVHVLWFDDRDGNPEIYYRRGQL